jgi:hypothetical protein
MSAGSITTPGRSHSPHGTRSSSATVGGALTLAAIVGLYAEAFGLDEDTAAAETFPALKRARMLDLVKRDNRYTDEGLYLRIRRDDGAGGERHRWIFLPPFAQRVLGLCSGAYSCREIAAVMRAERPSVPVRGIPDDALTPAIIACCLALEREGVVAWIDDEGAREARFEAFLRQELEGDSTP